MPHFTPNTSSPKEKTLNFIKAFARLYVPGTTSDLYARKLLDAEMPAITTNDMRSKWAASQAVISYQSWNGCETCIAALRQLSPDMEYVVLPLLQDEGGKVHAL